MNFIDYINLKRRTLRDISQRLLKRPHIIDARIRCAIDLKHVLMRSLLNRNAARTDITRLGRRTVLTVQGLGINPRRRRLTNSANAGKNNAAWFAFQTNRIRQGKPYRLLAYEVGKCVRTIFSSEG